MSNTPEPTEQNPTIVLFSEFLSTLKKGTVDDELTAALREVTNAVRNEQKTGSLTLTMSVAPSKGMDDSQLLIVVEKITSKVPKPNRANTFYYATDHGDLVKDDPRQSPLPFSTKESDTQ